MTSSELFLFLFRGELCVVSLISCAHQLFVSTTRQFHNDFHPEQKSSLNYWLFLQSNLTLWVSECLWCLIIQSREKILLFLCRCQGQRAVHRMSLSPLIISLKLGLFSLPSIINCNCNFMQLRTAQISDSLSTNGDVEIALCLGNFSLFVSFMALLGARRCFGTIYEHKSSNFPDSSPEYLQNKAGDTTKTTWHAHTMSFRFSANIFTRKLSKAFKLKLKVLMWMSLR